MHVRLTRRSFLATAAAGVACGIPGAAFAQGNQTRVGFVYVGPVGDHGWTYRHDIGRQAVEQAFGDQALTTFVESVSEGPDAERVIRQLAAGGHGLIFTTSFGFMNATVRVARQFPNVKFEHCTGYQRLPNLSTYAARFYEGRAVIGTIAGHMTKSGIIGYIGSFPIPEVIRGINSFYLAAAKVKPEIQIKIVYVSAWYDPGREADAAKTLIDQGADIIVQHTDSPAALQVAEQRGAFAFGQASDMRRFAPNAQLTAIVDNWNDYYVARVQAARDGTWQSQDTWGGLKAGMVEIAPYSPAVPPEVVEAAEQVKNAIIAGELHPFQGPIRNQQGEVVAAQGEVLSDADLLRMDYYVEGLRGSPPK